LHTSGSGGRDTNHPIADIDATNKVSGAAVWRFALQFLQPIPNRVA